jgi:hypothetical protein
LNNALCPHYRYPTAPEEIEVAAEGERDPARLRSEALSTVVTSAL